MDKRTVTNTPLPTASVDSLSGLAAMVTHRGGRRDLVDLADDLALDVDDVLPLVDTLELLQLARVSENDRLLTEVGTAFAGADVQESKTLFADAAMGAPLVKLITTACASRPTVPRAPDSSATCSPTTSTANRSTSSWRPPPTGAATPS